MVFGCDVGHNSAKQAVACSVANQAGGITHVELGQHMVAAVVPAPDAGHTRIGIPS